MFYDVRVKLTSRVLIALLPWVCMIIDHKRRQNVVRISVTLFCSYHILTSFVIHTWADAWKHGICSVTRPFCELQHSHNLQSNLNGNCQRIGPFRTCMIVLSSLESKWRRAIFRLVVVFFSLRNRRNFSFCKVLYAGISIWKSFRCLHGWFLVVRKKSFAKYLPLHS